MVGRLVAVAGGRSLVASHPLGDLTMTDQDRREYLVMLGALVLGTAPAIVVSIAYIVALPIGLFAIRFGS